MTMPLTVNDTLWPKCRKLPANGGLVRGLRVLVAEDDEFVRDLLSIILGKEGMTVTAVDDGQAAVDAATAQDFDLILMDMRMSGMGGFEATRRIRRLESGSYLSPIIALTGNRTDHEISQCQRAGMNAHIGKPFRQEQLMSTIRATLFE